MANARIIHVQIYLYVLTDYWLYKLNVWAENSKDLVISSIESLEVFF